MLSVWVRKFALGVAEISRSSPVRVSVSGSDGEDLILQDRETGRNPQSRTPNRVESWVSQVFGSVTLRVAARPASRSDALSPEPSVGRYVKSGASQAMNIRFWFWFIIFSCLFMKSLATRRSSPPRDGASAGTDRRP